MIKVMAVVRVSLRSLLSSSLGGINRDEEDSSQLEEILHLLLHCTSVDSPPAATAIPAADRCGILPEILYLTCSSCPRP